MPMPKALAVSSLRIEPSKLRGPVGNKRTRGSAGGEYKVFDFKDYFTALFDISHAIVRKFGSLLDNLCSDISAQPAVSGLSAGNEHELHRNQNLIIIATDVEVHFLSREELGLTCLLLLPTLTVGRVG